MARLASTTSRAVNLTFLPAGLTIIAVFIIMDGDSKGRIFVPLVYFMFMLACVYIVKVGTKVKRPDGSDRLSFPSGHAAVATFLLCHVLCSPFASPGFVASLSLSIWALAVCWARVNARRHSWEDVVAGGAIGAVMGCCSGRNSVMRPNVGQQSHF